jgi:hypothetical protein
VTLAGKMIRNWGALWADIDGGKGVLSALQKREGAEPASAQDGAVGGV